MPSGKTLRGTEKDSMTHFSALIIGSERPEMVQIGYELLTTSYCSMFVTPFTIVIVCVDNILYPVYPSKTTFYSVDPRAFCPSKNINDDNNGLYNFH